ncbi:MAG TPA: hypothetical protein VIF14_12260 [Alphaproteobacteria bacterium]|jgi:hypothetical protein
MMRLLPRLAVIVAFAAVPAGNQALAEWVEHKPAGIGYRIEMPEAPKVQSRDVPTAVGPIKTTMALVDRGAIGFIISHNDYPPDAIKGKAPDALLDGIRSGQVGSHKLRAEQKITMSGHPARHIVIDTAQGQVIVSRIVVVEARLFQAVYVGPKGSEDGDDAKRFINSFQLVDR